MRDFRIIVQRHPGGRYVGFSAELPGVMGGGDTPEACVADTLRSQVFCVAMMLEKNEPIPEPVSKRARTEQLNLRVSPGEKHALEEAAIEEGYRSVSDFVRQAALARLRPAPGRASA